MRGIIIPVLDLCQCLCLGETNYQDNSLIIILMFKTKWRWIYFGLLSEQVSNTYTIQYDEIKPILDNSSKLKKYLQGFITIGDRMVALLNTNYLGSIVSKQEIIS